MDAFKAGFREKFSMNVYQVQYVLIHYLWNSWIGHKRKGSFSTSEFALTENIDCQMNLTPPQPTAIFAGLGALAVSR